jgi:hypothetical protein
VLEECQNEKKRENRENKGVGSESFLFWSNCQSIDFLT